MTLKEKVIIITGASRGIGAAIAKACAGQGARVALLAKTKDPHEKLPGTIMSVAQEIEQAGGQALPIQCNVRSEDSAQKAVEQVISKWGQIDGLINNAGAIFLAPTDQTPMKRFDLVHEVNLRASYLMARLCLPHLQKAENPHILMMSPPLQLKPKWFREHLAYSLSKFGMSMCVLGMAEEFKAYRIAVNALWPRTTIATSAIEFALGGREMMERSRKPDIMADAALYILQQASDEFSGQFLIDEELLRSSGMTDFDHYAVDPNKELQLDLFVDG